MPPSLLLALSRRMFQHLDCKRSGEQFVAADVWTGLVVGGACQLA